MREEDSELDDPGRRLLEPGSGREGSGSIPQSTQSAPRLRGEGRNANEPGPPSSNGFLPVPSQEQPQPQARSSPASSSGQGQLAPLPVSERGRTGSARTHGQLAPLPVLQDERPGRTHAPGQSDPQGEGEVIDTLGKEVAAIVAPVTICMSLVVCLVLLLTPDGSTDGSIVPVVGALVYQEKSSDSSAQKFEGGLLNAAAFVVLVAVMTFGLVGLFYLRCTKCLWGYMGLSGFTILGCLGGFVAVQIIEALSIPIDVVTFGVALYNVSVVGVLAVFFCRMPIFLTQCYLVLIAAVVAFWFTHLPEWTTWLILVAMALYDLLAVLAPGGPLKLLIELAMEREEDLPALIYEARPPPLILTPPPESPPAHSPMARTRANNTAPAGALTGQQQADRQGGGRLRARAAAGGTGAATDGSAGAGTGPKTGAVAVVPRAGQASAGKVRAVEVGGERENASGAGRGPDAGSGKGVEVTGGTLGESVGAGTSTGPFTGAGCSTGLGSNPKTGAGSSANTGMASSSNTGVASSSNAGMGATSSTGPGSSAGPGSASRQLVGRFQRRAGAPPPLAWGGDIVPSALSPSPSPSGPKKKLLLLNPEEGGSTPGRVQALHGPQAGGAAGEGGTMRRILSMEEEGGRRPGGVGITEGGVGTPVESEAVDAQGQSRSLESLRSKSWQGAGGRGGEEHPDPLRSPLTAEPVAGPGAGVGMQRAATGAATGAVPPLVQALQGLHVTVPVDEGTTVVVPRQRSPVRRNVARRTPEPFDPQQQSHAPSQSQSQSQPQGKSQVHPVRQSQTQSLPAALLSREVEEARSQRLFSPQAVRSTAPDSDAFRVTVNSLSQGSRGSSGARAAEEVPSGAAGGGGGPEGELEASEAEFVLPGAIKLGLGDFIFYSIMVGRAAMYDMMTVYACYLAIIAGLGATLVLLAVTRRALPALPFSICLGVLFYLLTRVLLEPFVVTMVTSLLYF